MRVAQVNVTAARGSHGMIAEEIGRLVIAAGGESLIAYGREPHGASQSQLYRIGSKMDMMLHGAESRLLDNHGLASRGATRRLIKRLEEFGPDVVHLHNIHGYFLNYPLLFRWLKRRGVPVVWTLHDCWSFTGHCAYFGVPECRKWEIGCSDCPHPKSYPASFLLDRSKKNFELKKSTFTSLNNLILIPVSDWLNDLLSQSYLKDIPRQTIHNGIDINVFQPFGNKSKTPIILGVASIWEARKGLGEFVKLRELLPADWRIRLVGLTAQQIAALPAGIEGIERTSGREELARLYSQATVFVNPTFEDNFPTVNIEALACGTPVVTYRTGGSPEAIDAQTGIVVEPGDVAALARAVEAARELDPAACRARAEACFAASARYADYLALYRDALKAPHA